MTNRHSSAKERWAALLSVIFLAFGLCTFWFARAVLHAQGDAVLICLLLMPVVVYMIFSGRMTEIRAGGFEASFAELRTELDDVRFVLSMLLGPFEQQHLINLARGDTQGYVGFPSLRAELRKLRDLRLIEGYGIGTMEDGRQFDLHAIMKLTDLGKRCVERLNELKESNA
jgi:hypothetical protein